MDGHTVKKVYQYGNDKLATESYVDERINQRISELEARIAALENS